MSTVSLVPRFGACRMPPLAVHVAYIRHLAQTSALDAFLRKRHGLSSKLSRQRAVEIAPFLEQALAFHAGSVATTPRIRSVFQYYAYLNLAVALVLLYKPKDWEMYRKHGVEDITRSLSRLSLTSPVIRVRTGALPLFHSIISEAGLPKNGISLRDLLIAIPMVAVELDGAFGIRPLRLSVDGHVTVADDKQPNVLVSRFQFTLKDFRGNEAKSEKFPLGRLYKACPTLKSAYSPLQKNGYSRSFVSRQQWTMGNKDRAARFHDTNALRFVNFGGQSASGGHRVEYAWHVDPKKAGLLPSLTAALLLTFTLASLCRYRANLLDRVENSQINLLCEVFTNEADGFVIPAMRNLLYGETLYMLPAEYT